ncbi:XkdX family protein [Bombilactobacillus bombi]|uniref:XkdX family protein n=1 Tax=Bombilactobacillus bombi TaxID=1303590 RepID=A0A3R6ZBP3_9LACO|nr:XkdX family protein [Bombilactobacillus bombi]RHW49733.1 XkdX family protein [Bombilactobacillus bombi]
MVKFLFKLEYGWGFLSKDALQKYVVAKTITAADYQEITGEEYVDPSQKPVINPEPTTPTSDTTTTDNQEQPTN